MNTPTRWWAVGIVVVLGMGGIALAAAPVIDIPNEAAMGPITDSQRQQVDQYVAYYVGILGGAAAQDDVVNARRRLIDSYNRYGTRAQEYMMAFAASMAGHGKTMLEALAAGDSLASLKMVNLSITVSKMGQVTLDPLAVAMVSHSAPAVRYFGWDAFLSMRPAVLAAGGKPADTMFAALSDRLQKETDPHVLMQMMKMFVLRGAEEFGETVSAQAYERALDRSYKILEANWVGLCRKVMQADGTVAEAASIAVDALSKLKSQLKDQAADKAVAQMLANMAWAGGKGFDLAVTVQKAAEAVQAAQSATEENLAAATEKAEALAKKAGRSLSALPSAPEGEYAASATARLLSDCETSLNALTGAGNNFIDKSLKETADVAAFVRLGVLKWVEALTKKYEIKQPEELVAP